MNSTPRRGFREKGTIYYDWMHPSWRDLIIDHIASNSIARKGFLSRCGVQGIMLALSSAGGAEGHRQTPLMVNAQDWKVLSVNCLRLLEEGDHETTDALLSRLHDLMNPELSSRSTSSRPTSQLIMLAGKALETCRLKWNAQKCEIPGDTLKVFYLLSEFVSPIPPGPDLHKTWKNVTSRATKALKDSEGRTIKSVDEISKWVRLIETISKNEPRFLRKVEFPLEYVGFVQKILGNIENDLESDTDFESEDDYEDEVDRLSGLRKLCENFARVFPLKKTNFRELESRLSAHSSKIEEEWAEYFPEPDYDYKDYRGPSGGTHVEEVFRDL